MPSRTRLAFAILPLYAMSYAIPTLGTQEKIQVVRKPQTVDVIAPISAEQEASFKPFTFFASAAYCSSSATKNWNCGERCDANAGFIPTASGGDGTDVQFWYVGYDPSQNTVIVAHQGTHPESLIADATDIDFFHKKLDSILFPGIPSSIRVHSGFADEHQKTASLVLASVQQTLSSHPTASVTTVGHSLGAAISLLDAVFLPLHLPSSTVLRMVGYGLPRVGNQAFADYVDANLPASLAVSNSSLSSSIFSSPALGIGMGGNGITHITNQEDPVPILPGRDLGFVHPSGEIHILDNGTWVSCPGQDNDSVMCSTGAVPTIFEGDVRNHDGPYDGVMMGMVC